MVAIFLRRKPPIDSTHFDKVVVQKACSTSAVPHEESRHSLLAIQKWPELAILIFDVFHDDYDVSTAHRKAHLPVFIVGCGKRFSYVGVASPQFRERVNVNVAEKHNYNGWDGKPPYFEDRQVWCHRTIPIPAMS